MYEQPSNEQATKIKSNPTTENSDKVIGRKLIVENVINDKLEDFETNKYKIFNEDYQDNLMDEIFIV